MYNYCKKMGIPSKRKTSGQTTQVDSRKRKLHKSQQSGDAKDSCCDEIRDDLPLQASTLQEAVQTFCTDEADRRNITIGDQDCDAVNPVIPNPSSGISNLAEMVRGQLDSLRNITYTLNEAGSLQELYQCLQGILNQYSPMNQHIIQGGIGANTNSTAFIIHESVIDPITVGEEQLKVGAAPESVPNSLTVPVKDASSMVTTAKFRNTQVVENSNLRPIKPSMALQCLTTNVVPTLTMSQLPRSSEHGANQMITSLPSHSATNSATVSLTQPAYQTVAPVTHDASAIPVQLSLPPYLYYVQEVTIPETSMTNSTISMR